MTEPSKRTWMGVFVLLATVVFGLRCAADAMSPRLFFTEDTIESFRRRCAEGGDLEHKANAIVRLSRRYVGQELMPEPERLDGLKGPAYGLAYQKIFRAIRPPCGQMAECALAYLLTGDAELGAEAKRRLLHFTGFDPKGSTWTFHNDEAAMSILRRGCRAYDWTRPLYTDEERAKIERCLVIRAGDVYSLLQKSKFHLNPYISHLGRQIGFLLEACIALEREHPEMEPWRNYVLDVFRNIYPAWGGDDGGWNEGPHYWNWYMEFNLESLLAYRLSGGEDIMSTKPFFKNTPWYLIYQCPPGSPMSPFGDGQQAAPWYPNIIRLLSDAQDDPALNWFADKSPNCDARELWAFFLKDREPQYDRPENLPGTRYFPSVGLVCSHSDVTDAMEDVAFYFRASPYGSVSHGHNDQNCFAVAAWGEPLAIPSGFYDCFSSLHHDKWTRSTRAKCGITYDDVPSQIRGKKAASSILDYRDDGDVISFTGDATAAYGGKLTKALRDVVRLGRDVFVIRDTLAAKTPHTFKYWLHATDKMRIDEKRNCVEIVRPRASMEVHFLSPDRLAFSQTDAFDPPSLDARFKDRTQWHLSAETPSGVKATIVTVLVVKRAGVPSPWKISYRPGIENTVTVKSTSETYTVKLLRKGGMSVKKEKARGHGAHR